MTKQWHATTRRIRIGHSIVIQLALKGRQWCLVLRRKSLRAPASGDCQKRPTKANRRRLEAAIVEAQKRMPEAAERRLESQFLSKVS